MAPGFRNPENLGFLAALGYLCENHGKTPVLSLLAYVRGDYLNNKSILNVLHSSDDIGALKTLLAF